MIYTIEKIPAPIPSNIKGYLTNDTHSVLSFVHHRVSKAHTILTQTSQIFLLKVTLENIPLSPPTRLIFNLGLSNEAGLGWAGGFSSENVWISDSGLGKREEREAARPGQGWRETPSSVVGGGKESRKFLLITVKTSFSPLPSTLQMFAKTHFTSSAARGKYQQ